MLGYKIINLERWNLPGNLTGKSCWIEAGDSIDADLTANQIFPECARTDSDGTDNSDAGDDDFSHVYILRTGRFHYGRRIDIAIDPRLPSQVDWRRDSIGSEQFGELFRENKVVFRKLNPGHVFINVAEHELDLCYDARHLTSDFNRSADGSAVVGQLIDFGLVMDSVAGPHQSVESGLPNFGKDYFLFKIASFSDQDASGLCHAFHNQAMGNDRKRRV